MSRGDVTSYFEKKAGDVMHDELEAVKKAYAIVMPEWMENYDQTGNMRHDPYVVEWRFKSSIQSNLWNEIRSLGIPFYPKMPACGYFIDFANPFLKIGIECETAAKGDEERVRTRYATLATDGWMIFRLTSQECRKVIDLRMDPGEEPKREDIIRYYATSEGVLSAINWAYFGGLNEYQADSVMDEALQNHLATPETFPQPAEVIRENSNPIMLGDMMPEYLELMKRRMRRRS